MNNPRRKELEKALELLGQAHDIIETCYEEESDAFDNLPESIQDSERGEKMSDNVDMLSDILSTLDDIASDMDTIMYE